MGIRDTGYVSKFRYGTKLWPAGATSARCLNTIFLFYNCVFLIILDETCHLLPQQCPSTKL